MHHSYYAERVLYYVTAERFSITDDYPFRFSIFLKFPV